LLRRINVPREEIAELSELVREKELGKMFEGYSGYDVQETRRVARAEGLAEGRAEGRLVTAKNLKGMDLPVDVIAKATGLSVEEIDEL
jgi:predicted transposase/invertase (TIGR01784 family)